MNKKVIPILIVALLFTATVTYAWTPPGDIILQWVYGVYNSTTVITKTLSVNETANFTGTLFLGGTNILTRMNSDNTTQNNAHISDNTTLANAISSGSSSSVSDNTTQNNKITANNNTLTNRINADNTTISNLYFLVSSWLSENSTIQNTYLTIANFLSGNTTLTNRINSDNTTQNNWITSIETQQEADNTTLTNRINVDNNTQNDWIYAINVTAYSDNITLTNTLNTKANQTDLFNNATRIEQLYARQSSDNNTISVNLSALGLRIGTLEIQQSSDNITISLNLSALGLRIGNLEIRQSADNTTLSNTIQVVNNTHNSNNATQDNKINANNVTVSARITTLEADNTTQKNLINNIGAVNNYGTFYIGNVRLTNQSDNGLWNGSLSVYANNSLQPNMLLFAVMGNGTSGTVMPHFWIQNGQGTSASGISRSFMIVNEIPNVQNSENLTSCVGYSTFVNESLKVDCNTTTTGADLLVGDDIQINGDVWIKDDTNEWHFLSNDMSHTDSLLKQTVLDDVLSSYTVQNSWMNYTVSAGNNIELNFNGTSYGLNRTSSYSINITNGTNSTPVTHFVHFKLNGNIPELTSTPSYPSYTHIDIDTIVVGEIQGTRAVIFAWSRNRYENNEFIHRILERFEESGTLYLSGFDATSNATDINISVGTFFNGIYELETTNTLNSTSTGFYFINGTGHFVQATSLSALNQYSNGVVLGATERQNIVWGIVPVNASLGTGETQARLMAVLQADPGTGNRYTTDATARQDAYEATTYFPPNSEIKQVFVPIARTIVRPSVPTFIAWTGTTYIRFLGGTVSSGGSAPTPAVTDHSLLTNLDYTTAGHTGFAYNIDIVIVNGTISSNNNTIAENLTLIGTRIGNLEVRQSSDNTTVWNNLSLLWIRQSSDNTTIADTYLDGSGSNPYVPYWADSDTLGDTNLAYGSNTFGLGVATNTNVRLTVDSSTSTIPTTMTIHQHENSGTVYALNVTTDSTATTNVGALFNSEGATNNYAILVSNGNVGIGTFSPLERLTVVGAGNFTGDVFIQNISLYSRQSSDNTTIANNLTALANRIVAGAGNVTGDTEVGFFGYFASAISLATSLISQNGSTIFINAPYVNITGDLFVRGVNVTGNQIADNTTLSTLISSNNVTITNTKLSVSSWLSENTTIGATYFKISSWTSENTTIGNTYATIAQLGTKANLTDVLNSLNLKANQTDLFNNATRIETLYARQTADNNSIWNNLTLLYTRVTGNNNSIQINLTALDTRIGTLETKQSADNTTTSNFLQFLNKTKANLTDMNSMNTTLTGLITGNNNTVYASLGQKLNLTGGIVTGYFNTTANITMKQSSNAANNSAMFIFDSSGICVAKINAWNGTHLYSGPC